MGWMFRARRRARMNVSRPEAEDEYSSDEGGWQRRFDRYRAGVLALGLLGAVILFAAELTPLLHVRTVAAHALPVRAVQTGPHDGWALIPIAVAVVLLSLWVWRSGSRLGMLAIGLLGLAALVIALARDLPDAHATGLVGSPARGLSTAQAHAAVGLYLETLGAAIVLVTAAAGLLLEPSVRARRRRRAHVARARATD
jgi:hypothetical protein